MPKITVIVPVYNAEKTLRQCIDSILSQRFKDFELLLVDDGSKDQSPIICDEYAKADARVKVFRQENGGVSSARNLGLDHAKGEWITFIDSDDYITGGYLDGVVGREADLLVKGYKSFTPNGIEKTRTVEELGTIKGFSNFLNHFLTDSIIRCPWAKFYKRKIIDNIRFLHDMMIGEDACFVFLYLARCNQYAVLPEGEYMVRLANEPDEVKYGISVDYAAQSLRHLQNAYHRLVLSHGICKKKFLEYIGYFKRISKADWKHDKKKWYSNQLIKELYEYVWPDLTFKQKIRLTFARFIKR